MVLKKGKQPKSFEKNRYYIDMNKLENKSRSRLMYVFQYIATKELKWKDSDLENAISELNRKVEFPGLVKAMDTYIGDHVVFYDGPGDFETMYFNDKKPIKGDPAKKKKGGRPKGSKNKKSTTQDAMNEKLREHIAKDYGFSK